MALHEKLTSLAKDAATKANSLAKDAARPTPPLRTGS